MGRTDIDSEEAEKVATPPPPPLTPPFPPQLVAMAPVSDLKEGGEEEKEGEARIGKGKEEETNLPSFS